MSQNRNPNRRSPGNNTYEGTRRANTGRGGQAYVYGSAARQTAPVRRGQTASGTRAESTRQGTPVRRNQTASGTRAESTRQTAPARRRQAVPAEQMEPSVRKNRDKARYMNAGYLLFLVAAVCAATMILVNYIQLQAELTNRIRSVAAKESELNSMRIANDEEYNRIVSGVNLEEIRRIAIGELGMIYAQEEQIILYTNEDSDYMRPVLGSQ
ncbi:MAG: cell division protein FtsL [Roseburia sp.]|nr:cell division protein FtsL [Roseburia sp.]MCM1099321.1 cell division protein FtsL [Ruminococcus flavefaciens]